MATKKARPCNLNALRLYTPILLDASSSTSRPLDHDSSKSRQTAYCVYSRSMADHPTSKWPDYHNERQAPPLLHLLNHRALTKWTLPRQGFRPRLPHSISKHTTTWQLGSLHLALCSPHLSKVANATTDDMVQSKTCRTAL